MISNEEIEGKFLAKDIFDDKSGIIYFEAGDVVDENVLKHVSDKSISFLDILDIIFEILFGCHFG